MKLKDLIRDKIFSDCTLDIKGLTEDSREVKKDYIFFLKISTDLKEKFILEAIKNGSKLIIYRKNNILDTNKYKNQAIFYRVDSIDNYMLKVSEKFYACNKNLIKIYGVTGTNGKTTVTQFIAQLLNQEKKKCGIIGTIGNGIYPNLKYEGLTTPNIININKYIKKFSDKDVQNVAMEVSSHAISQKRVHGLNFDTVIFTNLSQDHLDYHKSMKVYFREKFKLFSEYKNKKKVICIDCVYGKKIARNFFNDKNLVTVSLKNSDADFYADHIKYNESGLIFKIQSKFGSREVLLNLYGNFTIINILLSLAAITCSKKTYNTHIDNILKISQAKGRMNILKKNGYPLVFIDYAHTPGAIKNVLLSVKKHFPNKQVITVFGCGGERDRNKRKKMGEIVNKYSDEIIITNDNPRGETPINIAKDIKTGISVIEKCRTILDRRRAIKKAISKKNSNKLVLILGKGHEQIQLLKNKTINISDEFEVKKIFS